MLIKTDHSGKKKSIFQCDMCNKIINTATDIRYMVSVAKPEKLRMRAFHKWDLCEHCFKILNRSIQNYKKKEGK